MYNERGDDVTVSTKPWSNSRRTSDRTLSFVVVVGMSRISDAFGMRLGRVPLQLIHDAQTPVVLVPPSIE